MNFICSVCEKSITGVPVVEADGAIVHNECKEDKTIKEELSKLEHEKIKDKYERTEAVADIGQPLPTR